MMISNFPHWLEYSVNCKCVSRRCYWFRSTVFLFRKRWSLKVRNPSCYLESSSNGAVLSFSIRSPIPQLLRRQSRLQDLRNIDRGADAASLSRVPWRFEKNREGMRRIFRWLPFLYYSQALLFKIPCVKTDITDGVQVGKTYLSTRGKY